MVTVILGSSSIAGCAHVVLCSTSLSHSRCRSVLADRDMLVNRCAMLLEPDPVLGEGCAMQHLSAAPRVQHQGSTSGHGAYATVELMQKRTCGATSCIP